jgi:hypothetical protein
MKGTIIMTQEGQKRVKIMEMIKKKKITQKEASRILKLSLRQIKRIYKKYVLEGDQALNHGLIGKCGNNQYDIGKKERIIKIIKNDLKGYKPTFTSEKLSEVFEINIHPNTLRDWMLKEGLWQKYKKMTKYRFRRTRKEHFGEMVQMDGSPHNWFGTGAEYCLMNMIDDATNIEFGLFDTGETTEIALKTLYKWIERYGIPQCLYTDYGSVFHIDREPNIQEQLKGIEPRTRFGQVCYELGIEIIYADSPQAKGRVERANGVQQERLINEMSFLGIKEIEIANRFLIEKYWDKHNSKYSKKPISDVDYHIPLLQGQDLRNIVCYSDERSIGNDFVVRLETRLFQILENKSVLFRPRDKVIIKTWLDGSVHIFKELHELSFIEIKEKNYEKIA